jgi:predicted flap endonuclease-1-like 5' DNA nuclease
LAVEGEFGMSHYLLELFLWMLFAVFVGGAIGSILYSLLGRKPVEVPTRNIDQPLPPGPIPPPLTKATEPMPPPQPAKVAETPAAPAGPAPALGRPARPKGIGKARGGKPDKLQRISGIGPKNERVLHNLGFFHFDQIAAWTAEQVAWVDEHLKFNGRITREQWVEQARLLAEGKDEEFVKLYGTGGLRDRSGEKKSGERTRRS